MKNHKKNTIRNKASLFVFLSFFQIACSSHAVESPQKTTTLVENNKSEGKPLLLISIDGFRPDYLTEQNAPNMWAFSNEGVLAKSLKPIFPSLTFPNHYTLVTGLYSEKHGIVGNEIRDPNIPERFTLNSPKEVMNNPLWWKGEPIWVTAQKQGLKSGILFWPGSEAAIQNILPTYYLPYVMSTPNPTRIEKLLAWIDLPIEQRPQFFTLYFDSVDTAGHRYGPGAPEVLHTVKEVDDNLGNLFAALQERNLYDSMNILIVSDHGMAALDPNKVVNISDVLAEYPHVDKIGGTAIASLFSNDAKVIEKLKNTLKEKSNLYTVYKKNEIPKRFHYQNSNRIPDLLLVGKEGVTIQTKPNFMPDLKISYKGAHGFDNSLPSMQAAFMARGPDFPAGRKIQSFDNVNLYALMCKLLNITPAPNDGNIQKAAQFLK